MRTPSEPTQPPVEGDSCYLCEIGKDGLAFPLAEGKTVLICFACVLQCIWAHPKLMHWKAA